MNRSIGSFLLSAAVAAYLAATGILGLTGRKFFPNAEIRQAVSAIFKGDFAEVLIVVLSILAIAAGAAVLIRLFGIEFPMSEMVLMVLAIVWLVFIIMIDIYFPLNSRKDTKFVEWLRVFGTHLMVLAGIALSTERFGG